LAGRSAIVMWLEIVFLVFGLFILIFGGDLLVSGASNIALRMHISPLVVGLTIVAFGTSAPELLISVKAALTNSPDLTMGNVVGSNICNLALVLGVISLINNIPVRSDSIKIDWPVTMGSSLLLYFVVKEKEAFVSRIEGILFIVLIISYTVFIIMRSRGKSLSVLPIDGIPDKVPQNRVWKDVAFILLGCIGLYFGAEWFVVGVKKMAETLGVSQRVIGITVVAIGTSLPELVTTVIASVRKETDLALGNLMGSNIFNILSILGITSLIKEIEVNPVIIQKDMVPMLGITLFLLPLMLYKRELGKISGILLLSLYVIYTYNVIT